MKRVLAVIFICSVLLCSCGKEKTPEGTYVAYDGVNSFCVVLNNGYCMIDVFSETRSEGVANTYVCGEYTVENDRVVVSIDKTKGIDGENFEFEFDGKTLVNIADGKVYERRNVKDVTADGEYSAEYKDMSFNLGIVGDDCSLDVFTVNDDGQTGVAAGNGSVNIDGNILTIDLEGEADENQQYRFIYSSASGILLDTSDGKIFERVE